MLQSIISEWMYRYGFAIIIIGCFLLIIAIIVYALIKKKTSDVGYKKVLKKKLDEKKMEKDNM